MQDTPGISIKLSQISGIFLWTYRKGSRYLQKAQPNHQWFKILYCLFLFTYRIDTRYKKTQFKHQSGFLKGFFLLEDSQKQNLSIFKNSPFAFLK